MAERKNIDFDESRKSAIIGAVHQMVTRIGSMTSSAFKLAPVLAFSLLPGCGPLTPGDIPCRDTPSPEVIKQANQIIHSFQRSYLTEAQVVAQEKWNHAEHYQCDGKVYVHRWPNLEDYALTDGGPYVWVVDLERQKVLR